MYRFGGTLTSPTASCLVVLLRLGGGGYDFRLPKPSARLDFVSTSTWTIGGTFAHCQPGWLYGFTGLCVLLVMVEAGIGTRSSTKLHVSGVRYDN
jgi:hypothetical protein